MILNHGLSAYEVSKKVIHLLRHSQKVHREEDGAVHFWRIKENLQNQFPQSIHWSDDRWKACLAAGGGAKKKIQYCTDDSGIIVCFRALQGHSGRNLVDPSLQDNVVIQSGFFHHIYHIGCAFNLHSIINSGLIPGVQNSSKRQTVFFLHVDPMSKEHKDPETIDLEAPRLAWYKQKKVQDAVYRVDIQLAKFSMLLLVLTVVDEMCFFFKFGTATNIWFDGLRGISLRAKAGGRQAATPRGRPPQAWNDHDPPHTAEGPPQAREVAYSSQLTPLQWSKFPHTFLRRPPSPGIQDNNRNCANRLPTHVPCGGHVCTRQLPTFLH